MNKNFGIRIFYQSPLVFILFFFLFFPVRRSFAGWVIDSGGTLVRVPAGQVLGRGSGDSGRDSSETASAPANLAEIAGPGVETESETEAIKNETEIRLGPARVKIESQATGRFRLKVENEAGEEVGSSEPEGSDLLKIDQREDEDQIRIATDEAEPESLVVSHKRIGASTALPISVDLRTNQLIVSGQSGSRVVAVLPDQAIANLLRNKILDQVGSFKLNELVNQPTASGVLARVVKLKIDKAGEPIYEVEGFVTRKILGLFPVTLSRRTAVSAQTGAVEKVEESIISRFLSLISL